MVYHGPSGGCKACRTRRVKCDQGKPHCSNCIRRRQPCPGYGDVFDSAHRSQNAVLMRRMKQQNGVEHATSATPNASSTSSNPGPRAATQWVIYSANTKQLPMTHEETVPNQNAASTAADTNLEDMELTIPGILKQNFKDACLSFFFSFYTGTIYEGIYEAQVQLAFVHIWQPLFLRSSVESPLSLATTAVTVNVAMMWCFRGCDAGPARGLFTKAIAATRKAIDNPSQRQMDELLMTILIFDLYDCMVMHYNPNYVTYGKHKNGALALLRNRGQSIYATDVSRGLTNITRHSLLHWALSFRSNLPPGAEELFDHPSMAHGKATQLEALSIQLVHAQDRLWTLKREDTSSKSVTERRQAYEELIAEAIRIDDQYMAWKRNIQISDWVRQYVLREEAPPSVLAAGFYGNRCAVWRDLVFADMFNAFVKRRLFTLQLIRQSLADEPSLLADPQNRAYLTQANATIQTLVDAFLETVPFHLGDTVVPTNPIYSDEISFPSKMVTDPRTGTTRSIPDLKPGSKYRSRAAASGGWMIFGHLLDIYRLAEPEDDAAVPIVLRDGQLAWMKGQLKRLQTIFLFCDPVWFRRMPQTTTSPSSSSSSSSSSMNECTRPCI